MNKSLWIKSDFMSRNPLFCVKHETRLVSWHFLPLHSHCSHCKTWDHKGCVIHPHNTLTEPVAPPPNIANFYQSLLVQNRKRSSQLYLIQINQETLNVSLCLPTPFVLLQKKFHVMALFFVTFKHAWTAWTFLFRFMYGWDTFLVGQLSVHHWRRRKS